MRKKLFIAYVITAVLLASCAQEDPIGTGRSDMTIRTAKATSRTIIPVGPEIVSYTVSLDGESEDYKGSFTLEEDITFSNILVGPYTVTVEAFDSQEIKVAEGSEITKVTADGENSVTINLDWLEEGTGKMSVDISWEERSLNGSGPFEEALENKSLGFRAMRSDGGAYVEDIKWAEGEDFTNKKFTFQADNLEKTDGTSIYFEIYTMIDDEPQVIAETFYTVIQVLPNLTSKPDQNENNNFKITDESIIEYIKNVRKTSVTASINEKDPKGAIDITWEYPKLSNGEYSGTLTATLLDSEGTVISTVYKDYTQNDKTGTETFTGLTPEKSYKITFQNKSSMGYSTTLLALENIRTKVVVTEIDIISDIKDTYTMGDSITIEAEVKPEEATQKDYAIEVSPSDGVEINNEDKSVRFTKSGDFTIKVKPVDASSTATAKKNVRILLSTPSSFESSLSEDGILLTWAKVESASGYLITKTIKEISKTETIEIDSNETLKYLDKGTYAGMTHSYTIQAVSEDGNHNSAISGATEEPIKASDITIKPPKDIENITLLPIDFGGKYLVEYTEKEEHQSISISLSGAIENAKKYEWLLNGEEIASSESFTSDVQNITINNTNENLKISSFENENTLTLVVTVNGNRYNISGSFYVISEELESISILSEGTVPTEVRYGSPITLTTSFTPSPVDIGYSDNPQVKWEIVSQSDENVAELTQENGITTLTAKRDGTVTIRATAVATGLTDEVTVKSYIPAMDVTIATPNHNVLVLQKLGVTVTSGYDTFQLSAQATPANGEKVSSAITWKSEDTGIVTVDPDGNLTAVKAGDTTITASIDGHTATQQITVLDIDIIDTANSNTITNKPIDVSPYSGTVNVQLIFNHHGYTNQNTGGYSCVWGFDDENTKEKGSSGWSVYLRIENENNFTARVKRLTLRETHNVNAFVKLNNETIAIANFTASYSG